MNDRVLRSAIASKLAYAKTVQKSCMMPANVQLHGHVRCDERLRDTWMIDNEKTGVHAYAWRSGVKSTIIAFKGTSNLKDIQTFFDAKPSQFNFRNKNVKVHSGVLKMFQSIEQALNKEIIDNLTLDVGKYITFCGHSLGGAIALFAAAYYSNMTNNNIQIACHTFGAPKMGDIEFHRWLEEGTTDIMNIVAEGDVVPHLPVCPKYVSGNRVILHNTKNSVLDVLKNHDLETYIESIRQGSELHKLPPPS